MFKLALGKSLMDVQYACHIQKFLRNTSVSVSAWIVAYIAIERALIALFPLKAKIFSSPQKAIIAVTGITTILTIVMSPSIILADWKSSRRQYLQKYLYFQRKIEAEFIRFIYSYVPIIVTSLFYLILLIKIKIAKIKRDQMLNTKTPKMDKFTKSVLILFITYVVLTAPYTVFILVKNSVGRDVDLILLIVGAEIVNILRVINYTCNFFIYFFATQQFRLEARKMLSRWITKCRRARVEPIGGNLPSSSNMPKAGSSNPVTGGHGLGGKEGLVSN